MIRSADRISSTVARAGRTMVLAVSAFAWTFSLLAGIELLSRPRAEGQEESAGESTPSPCRGWHRGAGATAPIDLHAVRASYRDLSAKLGWPLSRIQAEAPKLLDRPQKTGLARCVRRAVRRESLAGGADPRLAKQRFYFASLDDPARFRLPPSLENDPSAVILLLECARLRDVGDLSRRLGRPVQLATDAFAKALGVRCSGTRLLVSENGEEIELHEGE